MDKERIIVQNIALQMIEIYLIEKWKVDATKNWKFDKVYCQKLKKSN
jgi:hypothetical protein